MVDGVSGIAYSPHRWILFKNKFKIIKEVLLESRIIGVLGAQHGTIKACYFL